jgi:hypothetical protein
MAAGPAIEMWSRGEGEASSEDGLRRSYRRTRAFTVTLSADDQLEVAFSAAGLPIVGDSLPNVPLCICRRLRPVQVSPIMAMIVAEYSGEVGPSGVTNTTPIDNPIVVNWASSITDEPIDEDINGSPIVTANNEPIDGLSERFPDAVCTIQRNFANINVLALEQFLRSTNSDAFAPPGTSAWPAGTVRFMGYTANQVFGAAQSTGYWSVTGEFHCRYPYNTTAEKAWWKRVRHEGFLVREVADGDIFHGSDDRGELLSRPVLLQADGTVETDPESAHFLEFETVFSLPYADLGFI